ncbi:MAG: adenylate/guanylate cyclase domain-containing protein [Treponema sp.]|nr:adenylate/guanylate cyclase domain-containing protein [Treponema sp.]
MNNNKEKKLAKKRFFQYVGKTPIIPISLKILLIFIPLILMSSFMTNLISVQLSQRQVTELTNRLTVTQLKELYKTAGNQYQIYSYKKNKEDCVAALESAAMEEFSNPKSVAMGFDRTGKTLFWASANGLSMLEFPDKNALGLLNERYDSGTLDGQISFDLRGEEFYGVYKFSEDWNVFLVRAEARSDTARYKVAIMLIISAVILLLTIIFVALGIFMFKKVFSSISKITQSLYDMQQRSQLATINIDDAPNDDVTYMAASFNSLSVSVNNLLTTFQKFVSKDVVSKAYTDHTIKLEGMQRELTILFSDIKSFTYRTETLGNEIIDLLNVHYNNVIHDVHQENGVVGSIIGDAILAIFGSYKNPEMKSLEAIDAGWRITYVTAELREKMKAQRKKIEETRKLTAAEDRVYKAVLLDIGVGIDGGTVFYGNIGSDEHMTNTVIGDNVNSASRLEGVTRIYHLPIVVSEYIMDDVKDKSDRYKFFEIDTIQVKGKTKGKKIYFPLDTENEAQRELIKDFELYEEALQAYYSGDWKNARKLFKKVKMEVAGVFMERMGARGNAPEKWKGIWTMTTK